MLSPATGYAGEYIWQGDVKQGCERILKDSGIAREEWQMGVTKAFIKNPETVSIVHISPLCLLIRTVAVRTRDDARPILPQHGWPHPARLEKLLALQERVRAAHSAVLEEQQGVVGPRAGRSMSTTGQVRDLNACLQVREYGHQVLAQRKERRRYSLLSYRRFLGDYLDVGGSDPVGETIRDAAGISSTLANMVHSSWVADGFWQGERRSRSACVFNCSSPSLGGLASRARDSLLLYVWTISVRAFQRLRFFAITQTEKAVYFVVNTEKTGMTLERKVPLVTIKSLAMSSLRDDWIVLNLGPTEEGDPVFSCVFKTELASTIITLTNASINLLIGPKFVPLFIAYHANPDILH